MRLVTHLLRSIIACFLLGVFIFGGVPVKAHAKTDAKISDTIELLGIIKDTSGKSIVQEKYATREEFAQMLVQVSPYAGDAKTSKTARLFRDVKTSDSKANYIQLAVSKGYMSGYLNGKFKPKQAVTMKEAAYGVLSLLGYSSADFTNQLSGSRFEKFKELGLNKNIQGKETDKLTEEDCNNLFYNLLNTKQKNGESYSFVLNYTVDEDGVIDYQALLKKETKGPYIVKEGWDKQLAGKAASYQKIRDNKISSADMNDYNVIYYSDQARRIWVYSKRIYGCLDDIAYMDGKPQKFTVSGEAYTVEKPEDMKAAMKASGIQKADMVVLLLGRDDKVSFMLPIVSELAGGTWIKNLGFDYNAGTFYRNGKEIAPLEIKNTDVIYYSRELKTVWVYGSTTYGVLSSITPSLSLPEQLTVAGNTYRLDSRPINSESGYANLRDITENDWGKRLREYGIEEGDNVVVYFGYDGNVAEIRKVDEMSAALPGYVLEITDKVVNSNSKDSSVKQIIKIIETGGTVLEFECDDSSITKGDAVEVTFQSGKAEIKKIDEYASNSIFELPKRKFTENARIIEVNNGDYKKLSPVQMEKIEWDYGNVIYSRLNSEGKIADLILKDATDSFSQYAFLKKVISPDYAKGIYSYELTFDSGTETTLVLSEAPWDLSIGPKAIRYEDNKLKEMKTLQRNRLQYINGKQANSGSQIFRIADDVLVYYYKNGEYYKGTFDSVADGSNSQIDGYSENSQSPIHIIVVTK